MTTPSKNPSPQEEALLEQLLKSVYADPPSSEEFQEALYRQLDQEFVRAYPAELPLHTKESVPPRLQAPRLQARRITLRLAVTMATAASLLFAVALWNMSSTYGWSTMLHAMEKCGWVQAVSETTELTGWVSSEQGIVAIRDANKAAFLDRRERFSAELLSGRQVIYQQVLSESRASLGPEGLFQLLLCGNRESEGTNAGLRVISESWRQTEPRAGKETAIELRVTLRGPATPGKNYNLLILLDPETHLPKTFRLLANGRDSSAAFDFNYPVEGPSSIYSLGISRDTEVIALLAKQTKKGSVTTPLAAQPVAEPAEQPKKLAQRFQAEEIVIQPSTPATETTQPATQRVASTLSRPIVELPALALPEKLFAPQALVEQVNAQLAASWQAQGISPVERASDTEFLRRVYLDLAGRIPMVSEVYQFLEDTSQGRRERLVDELLASRDHATHLATVWRKILLPEGTNANIYGGTEKFDQWLGDRFEKNLPYDQLVRQLLLAEGRVSGSGPILFYAALKLNPEELAGKTARVFLGMRMECAQCHDHPFDESILQEDFWGFAAHFAQISRPRGKIEVTSSVMRVRDNRRGEVTLPDSDEVILPRLPYAMKSVGRVQDPQSEKTPSEKNRSRREALADWLTTTQNSHFARAAVNRVWQHLFGLGLVEPVDDMRTDNRATCPEVLETLSLDFAASGYDLRRLLRALVLSDAYQLSSRAANEPSQARIFARMNIKSFTADQLYDCISVATQYETMRNGNTDSRALARFGNNARQAFITQFRAPLGQRTDYHAGIPQALTLMHGRLVHGATDLASSGLLKSLNAPFFTDEQRIKTLFLSTLSRVPDSSEQKTMLAYLKAASGDEERSRALGDILWALLNSAEFTFIH